MSNVLTEVKDRVLRIELARTNKKNALTQDMYRAMSLALAAAEADAQVRAILIHGTRDCFTAGNDLKDFLERPPHGGPSASFDFISSLPTVAKPLIAAVGGPAVGIGTTMLLHCDLVSAGDNAACSTPFVNLGLCPEAASSLLLPQMLGYHRAAEALLLGEPFMAEAALEVGLVNRVVPPSEANNLAQAQARKLAAKPISSLLETKRLMKKGQSEQVSRRIVEELSTFGRMMREPAAREAFNAFMERRKPDFSKV